MLNDITIAQYFLSKDQDRTLFNKNVVSKNGRSFYEGNARLNKYLHLAQNIYIAMTGAKLFEEDLYAYDNGAVALAVQENYAILLSRIVIPALPEKIRDFLDKLYAVLANASLDELIEISHEDEAWQEKHTYYAKENQRMDSLSHLVEYQEQYRDIIKVMERMDV